MGLYSITAPGFADFPTFLFFSLCCIVLVSYLDGDAGLSFALTGLNLVLISLTKFSFLILTYFSYGLIWPPIDLLSNISLEIPETFDIFLLVLAKDSFTDFNSSLLVVPFLTKYCFSVSFEYFRSAFVGISTFSEMWCSSSSFLDFFRDWPDLVGEDVRWPFGMDLVSLSLPFRPPAALKCFDKFFFAWAVGEAVSIYDLPFYFGLNGIEFRLAPNFF